MSDEYIYRVAMRQVQDGVTYDSAFHVVGFEDDSANRSHLEDEVVLLNGEWQAAHGAHVELEAYSVQWVYHCDNDEDFPGGELLVPGPGAGTRDLFSFDPLAVWLGMLVRIGSEAGGRRRRNRFFLSPLTEGDVTQDTINAGAGSALAGVNALVDEIWNIWDADFGTSLLELHVFSPTDAGQTTDPLAAHPYGGKSLSEVAAPAVKPTVSTKLTSQRGRRR